MIKTVKLFFKKNVTVVWVRCQVSEVWLSRNGYIMEQIKVAGTLNKTDWAILRVFDLFDRKYLFKIKNNKYFSLMFGCRGGGGWLPRNGSIIEQIWSNKQLLIEVGQIGPRGGY